MDKVFTTRVGGFHITFPNGLCISVQIGAGMYSDNHSNIYDWDKQVGSYESDTAEIAVLHKNNLLIPFDDWYDQVKGYCTLEEVWDVMKKIKEITDVPKFLEECNARAHDRR